MERSGEEDLVDADFRSMVELAPKKMTMINTVTGQILPKDLGRTLMHEHVQFGYPGFRGDLTLGNWDKEVALVQIKEHLNMAKGRGVRTIVDATPNECGRDAAFLKRLISLFFYKDMSLKKFPRPLR